MTQGIVAKVEENVLLGDFLIQPGNSGGPLVTLNGEVIGINTFTERAISGAVRVSALRSVLSSDDVATYDQPDPSEDPLPTLSAKRYPTDVLREKILKENFGARAYVVDGGKFTVTAITPVLLGRMQVKEDMVQAQNRFQRRGKKAADPTWREVDGPFYEWMRTASEMLSYAVTFEVKPDFGSTAGSKWAAALMAFSAGVSNTPMQPVHQTMEFKAEFQDFKVYRDGKLLAPVHPGRAITEASFQSPLVNFVDEAYSGMYIYAPEDFMTGRLFRLEVYDAREPGKPHKVITLDENSTVIRQIRADFAGTSGGTQ